MNRKRVISLILFIGIVGFLYYLATSFSSSETYSYNREREKLEIHIRDGNIKTINIPARTRKYLMYIDEVMRGPLQQDDPRILDFIQRKNYIQPPSPLQYNLTNPGKDPSAGQSGVIKKIFKNMRNGFFVECGALDGETRSNTLDLEFNLGWNGLLIEGDPKNYKMLLSKHRKAWTSNSCIATKPYPHEVEFEQHFNIGKIKEDLLVKTGSNTRSQQRTVRVQCFPLFSLLSLLNVKTVDYFSLDVEGAELQVLRTIPFDLLNIKVLSVEYIHNKEGTAAIQNFMSEKGYRVVTTVKNKFGFANDFIFMHNSVNFTDVIPPVKTSKI